MLFFSILYACFLIDFIRTKRQSITGHKVEWQCSDGIWIDGYLFIRLKVDTLKEVFDVCLQCAWPRFKSDVRLTIKLMKLGKVFVGTFMKRLVYKSPVAIFVSNIISSNHSNVPFIILWQAVSANDSKGINLVRFLQIDCKVFCKEILNAILVNIWVSFKQ